MLATSNVGHLPFSPLILYRLEIRIQIILVDSICQRIFDGEKNAPVFLPLFESSHIARSVFCFPEAYFLIAPPPPALSCQREVFSCHFTIILLPLPTPPGRLHLASVCFQLPLSVAQLSQPAQAGDGEGEVGSWGWCVCGGVSKRRWPGQAGNVGVCHPVHARSCTQPFSSAGLPSTSSLQDMF